MTDRTASFYEPVSAEQRAAILDFARRHFEFKASAVAAHLGVSRPAAQRCLTEMSEGGDLQPVHGRGAVHYRLADTTLDPHLVVEAYKPRIHAALAGRRMMPSTLARDLGLPLDQVRETCRAMQQAGALVATPVGASFIYAHNPRLTSRVDPELARCAPQSTEARFLAQLATLPREGATRSTRRALEVEPTPLDSPPAPMPITSDPAPLRRVVQALDSRIPRGVMSLAVVLCKSRINRHERAALEEAVRVGFAGIDELGLNYVRTPAGTAWLGQVQAVA